MAIVQPRILIVLDGEDHTSKPDADLARGVALVYFELRRMGAETVFACDRGGYPLVAGHMRHFSEDPIIAAFLTDQMARNDISDALSLDQIVVEDFDVAAFFPVSAGDLGAAWALKNAFLAQGKTVVFPKAPRGSRTPGDASVSRSSATDVEWINQLRP